MHSRILKAAFRAELGLALTLCTGPASAHGGLFRADELRVDPGDPSHMIVRSDVWGLVETHDQGKTWNWTCAAAPFGDDLTVLREPLGILPGGTVFVGSTKNGVVRSKGSLCDFEIVSFFQNGNCAGGLPCVPYDMAADSSGPNTVLVLTNVPAPGGEFANELWRSSDAGDTWTSANATLPADIFATAVVAAPSDPSTVYVGSSNTKTTYYLHGSTDGGRTFTQTTLPFTPGPNDPPARMRFHGVHPKDPSTVFVWLDADLGTAKAPDRLFVSFDGGASIVEAYVSKNDLPGFAISPDGSTVFVGGTDEGLWSAALTDLKAGNADAFHPVNSGGTWSLAFTEQGLLAGREEFPADAGVTPMTLGLSTDQGATFQSALSLCDVHLAACATQTRAGNLCPDLYYGDYNFQFDMQRLHCASAPKPPSDAGTTPKSPPANADDAGCRTARFARPVPQSRVACAALTFAACAIRRKRRAPSSRSRGTNRRTS